MNLERIGKYRIVGEIGRGTMGEVYRALDPDLNRHVALKTLSARVRPDDEAFKRFKREAQAAALLSHPNIVTIHEFGEERGILYMAMELLEGTDLRDAIDNGRLRTLDEKIRIMDKVLTALEYAHIKGVIHRDVKPANIHLGPADQVKIMDFGLARISTSEMTQDGIVLGTPNYMSPEQALGDKVDGRSDLFSTGAVFYELLTGHKPFEADSTPSVLFQVVHRPPPPVRRWVPDVPMPLVDVVEKALVKDKKLRFQSAGAMRAALAAARPGAVLQAPPLPARPSDSVPPALHVPAPRPATPPPIPTPLERPSAARRGRRLGAHPLMAGVALALLAVAAIAVTVAVRQRPVPAASPAAEAARVGALTRALVATQAQLAQRELENKNYAAAAAQAESALRLAPESAEASRVLAFARQRVQELETAVREARALLATGDTAGASAALSRLLELDPRHPAAAELSAQLNSVFRTQAEEAAVSMGQARSGAETAGAPPRAIAEADARAREGEALLQQGEYADATRAFLEARDTFDRAGRAARPRPSPSAPVALRSPAAPSAARPLGASPTPAPTESTAVPVRRFVTGTTSVATRAAGGLEGFDTADVTTLRMPQFVGRMEFEVLPTAVRTGEPFVVRVLLVNEGRKTVRIRSIALATIVGGRRDPAPVKALQREVAPQQRALVAEYSALWPETGSWSLEAVVTADRDETVSGSLNWM